MSKMNNLEFECYRDEMIRAAVYDHKRNTLVSIYGGVEKEEGWDPQIGTTEYWFMDCERITIPEVSYEDFLRNGGKLILDAANGKLAKAAIEHHMDIMMENVDYGGSWYGYLLDSSVQYKGLVWVSKNRATIEQKLLFQDYDIEECGPWIQNCLDAIKRRSTAVIVVDKEFAAPDLLQQLLERTDKPVVVQNVNGDWVRVNSVKAEPYTL